LHQQKPGPSLSLRTTRGLSSRARLSSRADARDLAPVLSFPTAKPDREASPEGRNLGLEAVQNENQIPRRLKPLLGMTKLSKPARSGRQNSQNPLTRDDKARLSSRANGRDLGLEDTGIKSGIPPLRRCSATALTAFRMKESPYQILSLRMTQEKHSYDTGFVILRPFSGRSRPRRGRICFFLRNR